MQNSHNRTLLVGSTPLKHGLHLDYRNHPLNISTLNDLGTRRMLVVNSTPLPLLTLRIILRHPFFIVLHFSGVRYRRVGRHPFITLLLNNRPFALLVVTPPTLALALVDARRCLGRTPTFAGQLSLLP
jgi:hypothetical protein